MRQSLLLVSMLGSPVPSTVHGQTALPQTAQGAWLVVDEDDDDDNGVADNQQNVAVPQEDLWPVPRTLLAPGHALEVVGARARLIVRGRPQPTLSTSDLRGATPYVQGLAAGSEQLRLTPIAGGHPTTARELRLHIARLQFLDGNNQPLTPAIQDARFSLQVANDPTLPRDPGFHVTSPDPLNLRIALWAPGLPVARTKASIHSEPTEHCLPLELRRGKSSAVFRSPYVRLVADQADAQAPGVQGQLLRAALGQPLQAQWLSPDGRLLTQNLTVGLRSPARGLVHSYQARLRIHVLRTHPGGPPVIGHDRASAQAIVQAQVRAANQIWAQCGIHFGAPAQQTITVVAPPPPALLSVASGNGLPSYGNGQMYLQVNGQPLGPVPTRAWQSPTDTALVLADHLQRAGFPGDVTENPRTRFGALPSADILVRTPQGDLAHLLPIPGVPISSDRRQRVTIGLLDLADGLMPFDNMSARAGTLEERALLLPLSDGDPTTIDVVIINYFSGRNRQGEAFIATNGGPLANMVVLDRRGLQQQRHAWTLAHELGHVLLDDPQHPDRFGTDSPFRLMDADSTRGTVYGPKRLTAAECQTVLRKSGPTSAVPILIADPLRSPMPARVTGSSALPPGSWPPATSCLRPAAR